MTNQKEWRKHLRHLHVDWAVHSTSFHALGDAQVSFSMLLSKILNIFMNVPDLTFRDV